MYFLKRHEPQEAGLWATSTVWVLFVLVLLGLGPCRRFGRG